MISCIRKPEISLHIAVLLPLLLAIFSGAISQPRLTLDTVIKTGLSFPVDFVNAGDGTERIFIVQQGGTIKVYDKNFNFLNDFLTITGIPSGGEQGLLSMAFHPQYKTNGYFFVYYTNSANGIEVARYHVSNTDPNAADPDSKQIVLTVNKPVTFFNHNGGKLNFSPVDGNLYFGLGDGGGTGDPRNYAQRSDSLFGKMVRINVDNFAIPYTIPNDNPYINSPDTLPEIWAFGLRNPWRWSFDRETHDMWIADVGQGRREEVNFIPDGTGAENNYGWHCWEGTDPYNGGCPIAKNYVPPIFDYAHDAQGGISITGGYVYRGLIFPALQGYYICADYMSGNAFLIKYDGAGGFTNSRQPDFPSDIVSFGETENAELFMVTRTGTIFQVGTDAVVPVELIDFSLASKVGGVLLSWKTANEIAIDAYEVQYSTDGDHFNTVGSVRATGATEYSYFHSIAGNTKAWYRLKIKEHSGNDKYSKTIINLSSPTHNGNFIRPSVIVDGMLHVYTSGAASTLQLIGVDGKLIWQTAIKQGTSMTQVPVHAPAGKYVVRIITGKDSRVQAILVK